MEQGHTLFRKPEKEYGDQYRAHLLDIYKRYVDSAEKTTDRRQSTNSFFLTVNTALIALTGYLQLGGGGAPQYYGIVSIAGMVLCMAWYLLIRSYRGLNRAKFEVITAMEQHLPAALFHTEWLIIRKSEKGCRYLSFSRVESVVPWVFSGPARRGAPAGACRTADLGVKTRTATTTGMDHGAFAVFLPPPVAWTASGANWKVAGLGKPGADARHPPPRPAHRSRPVETHIFHPFCLFLCLRFSAHSS